MTPYIFDILNATSEQGTNHITSRRETFLDPNNSLAIKPKGLTTEKNVSLIRSLDKMIQK